MEMSDELHAPASLPPGKQMGGWLGLRVGLEVMEKRKIFCFYRESNPDSSFV
jgi:hypothetical protein